MAFKKGFKKTSATLGQTIGFPGSGPKPMPAPKMPTPPAGGSMGKAFASIRGAFGSK